MTYFGCITVLDRSGWRRLFPLEKALTMVGSDKSNDIVLGNEHGDGVAPIHLQLIYEQSPSVALRVLNLRNTPVTRINLNTFRNAVIQPQRLTQIFEGDQLTLGNFTLTVSLTHEGYNRSNRSENMGMEVKLPQLHLEKNKRISGKVKLTTFSQQKRGQFDLDVLGIAHDCYQIDPAPNLYPGASEELSIHFFHREGQPLAGQCPVQIILTAPNAFPDEMVTVECMLQVAPVLSFQSGFNLLEDQIFELQMDEGEKGLKEQEVVTLDTTPDAPSPVIVQEERNAELPDTPAIQQPATESIPVAEAERFQRDEESQTESITEPSLADLESRLEDGGEPSDAALPDQVGEIVQPVDLEPVTPVWEDTLPERFITRKPRPAPDLSRVRILRAQDQNSDMNDNSQLAGGGTERIND